LLAAIVVVLLSFACYLLLQKPMSSIEELREENEKLKKELANVYKGRIVVSLF
jgi:hypothetical protein